MAEITNDISYLRDYIIKELDTTDKKLIFYIYGKPGSGKSTISAYLTELINNHYKSKPLEIDLDGVRCSKEYLGINGQEKTSIQKYDFKIENRNPVCCHIKMDGFHIPWQELKPELREYRGCSESFDVDQVLKLNELLLCEDDWSLLTIPDFDHQLKDPTRAQTKINFNSRLIIFEGLYMMLDIGKWSEISKLVEVSKNNNIGNTKTIKIIRIDGGNVKALSERVAKRHLKSGLVDTLEEGIDRYFKNDLKNSEVIEKNSNTSFDDFVFINE